MEGVATDTGVHDPEPHIPSDERCAVETRRMMKIKRTGKNADIFIKRFGCVVARRPIPLVGAWGCAVNSATCSSVVVVSCGGEPTRLRVRMVGGACVGATGRERGEKGGMVRSMQRWYQPTGMDQPKRKERALKHTQTQNE